MYIPCVEQAWHRVALRLGEGVEAARALLELAGALRPLLIIAADNCFVLPRQAMDTQSSSAI